jgi:hypothetical protein
MFLRDYLDAIFYQQNPNRRKRTRVYDNLSYANEVEAPLNAPRWTRSGYNGSMRAEIKKAISKNSEKDDESED